MPSAGKASPMNSLSTPAMMRSSVDLPAPLPPMTPILAPGIEREVDALEDLALGRDDLAQVLHREDVLLGHGASVLAQCYRHVVAGQTLVQASAVEVRASTGRRWCSPTAVMPPESHRVVAADGDGEGGARRRCVRRRQRRERDVVAVASKACVETPWRRRRRALATVVPDEPGRRWRSAARSMRDVVPRARQEAEAVEAGRVVGDQRRAGRINGARGRRLQRRAVDEDPLALLGAAESSV